MAMIYTRALYGAQCRQPLVELRYQDLSVQLSPEDARELAMSLLQTAEAAEQDAFLVEWSQQEVHATLTEAVGLLEGFRKWREARADKLGRTA